MCPASAAGQAGRCRCRGASRPSGSSRAPGRLGDHVADQRLDERAQPALAVDPGVDRRPRGQARGGRPSAAGAGGPSCSRTTTSNPSRPSTIDSRTATTRSGMSPPTMTHDRLRARPRAPRARRRAGPRTATGSWTTRTSSGHVRGRVRGADHDDLGRDGPDGVDGVAEQRPAVDRLGELVAPEPARPAAGEDHDRDARARSRGARPGHVTVRRPAQDRPPVEVGQDRHDVLAAGPRRVAQGGRRQRCRAGHRQGRGGEVAVRGRRVGEVGLEDDDPAAAFQLADPGRRAGGGSGGFGQARRGRDRERALRGGPSPRPAPDPARRRAAPSRAGGPTRRRVRGGRRGRARRRPPPRAARRRSG